MILCLQATPIECELTGSKNVPKQHNTIDLIKSFNAFLKYV